MTSQSTSEERPDQEKANRDLLCAVIITYHPDGGFHERVRQIAGQVARVLVVDNHSDADSLAMLRGLCISNLDLIENSENRGIAAALNQGMNWAKQNNFERVLTFDQDSFAGETLAETVSAAFTEAAGISAASVAVVGANYRQTADGHPGYTNMPAKGSLSRTGMPADKRWMPAEYVITSGSLLSLEAYTAIGPFREDFFIDYVDIDYCFRARALGFGLFVTREILMEHTVGAMTPHRLLRTWWVSNYASWRWYYRARNLAVTSRAFYRQEPRWVREAWLNLLLTSLKILLFETEKADKVKNIRRGLWEALSRPDPLSQKATQNQKAKP